MAERWSLLALVVAVASGLVALTVSATLSRSRQTDFFRLFLAQLLLFNLLTLGGLVVRFVQWEAAGPGGGASPPLLAALLTGLAALKLAWLGAFALMAASLAGASPDRRRIRRGALTLVLLFALGALLVAKGVWLGPPPLAGIALSALEGGVLLGALSASVWLLARTRTLPPGPGRARARGLGALYVGLLGVVVLLLLFGWVRDDASSSLRQLGGSSALIAFNLLPLVWVVRIEAPPGAWDPGRYGLTPREDEIARLVAEGRTNQEIADALFISLATVKDHNYSLFKKTGVRNRTELASLVRAPEPGPPGPGQER